MRRLVLILTLALAPLHSYAQQTKVWTENLSTASTLGAAEAATTLNIDGRLGVGVQITTANLAATITPEVSCDKGVTWVASTFTTVAGVTAATLVFSGGADTQIRQIATIGCTTHVRVRVSAYTSGTSVGRITATATRAASGGGAASSVEPGTTTVTGCQNRVIYGDNSSVLNCEAAFGYVTSTNTLTADTAAFSTLLTIPGGSTASTATLLSNDTDTFIGSVGAGNISLYTNGTERYRFDGTGNATFASTVTLGSLASPTLQLGSHATSVGYIASSIAGTSRRFLMGGGTAVASAATLPAPTGSVFHVTGTTNITTGITTTNLGTGVQITLIFDGILTVSSGGNLIIVGGTYVTTANDTLTLVYDGTNFFEIARTVL